MNDAAIKELLRERNPWWRDAQAWRPTDRVLRDVDDAPFVYVPDALDGIAPPSLYVLTGPRRVGKSVAMRRKIQELLEGGEDPRSIVYCSCDGFRPQDLRRLFKAGRALMPAAQDRPMWWFIDEVTAVGEDWGTVVKSLRDDTALRGDCVVLTGSSATGLRQAVDALAGRRGPDAARSDRLLLPMGFRSFCAHTGVDTPALDRSLGVADLTSSRARDLYSELAFWTESLVDAWENYLRIGGFPQAVADFVRSGDVGAGFVQDLWDVVRGDAIRAAALPDPTVLALLERLGLNLASPVNASDVARDVGLADNHAANNRIADLVGNFLAWRCPRASGERPNERAQRKVYFTDPLLARLAGAVDGSRAEPSVSKLSEQQVGVALGRAIDTAAPGSFVRGGQLMHMRTVTKAEIDFVGPDLDGCVEGKYVDTGWRGEAQTARANFGRGILATRRVLELDDAIWAVPAPILAWLLDPVA